MYIIACSITEVMEHAPKINKKKIPTHIRTYIHTYILTHIHIYTYIHTYVYIYT